jgi:hypothetical protein
MITPKRFKRYKTVEKLMANFFGVLLQDLGDFSMGHDNGEVQKDEFIESVRMMGIWGYVDDKRIVHFWMDNNVPFETFLMFIAHETGHLNGHKYKDGNKEEEKAHLFDQVALYAFRQASRMKSDNKILKQIISLIHNDTFAITFPNMSQYRSALIKNIARMIK